MKHLKILFLVASFGICVRGDLFWGYATVKNIAGRVRAWQGLAPVSGQLSLRPKDGSHGQTFLRSRVFARCCYLKGVRTTAVFLPWKHLPRKREPAPANPWPVFSIHFSFHFSPILYYLKVLRYNKNT